MPDTTKEYLIYVDTTCFNEFVRQTKSTPSCENLCMLSRTDTLSQFSLVVSEADLLILSLKTRLTVVMCISDIINDINEIRLSKDEMSSNTD